MLHVTACAIRETPEDATEQQIGIQVFQRSPGFNSSEDSIVRSHARLLRLKLSAYFSAEGASEPLIIEIPKGHYLPVFLPTKRPGEHSTKSEVAPIIIDDVLLADPARMRRTWRERGWLAASGVGLALLLCLALVVVFRWQRQAVTAKPVKATLGDLSSQGIHHWSSISNALFVGDAKSGMRYAANDGSDGQSAELVDNYTGIGELISVHELTKMFDYQHAEFVLKRSPLVTWDEARSRNLIFIGSIAENASLKLLPSTQDFTLIATADAAGIVNHHPRLGSRRSICVRNIR